MRQFTIDRGEGKIKFQIREDGIRAEARIYKGKYEGCCLSFSSKDEFSKVLTITDQWIADILNGKGKFVWS